MKNTACFALLWVTLNLACTRVAGQNQGEVLGYHPIRTDAHQQIIPWNHTDPAEAYDEILGLTWKYWSNIPGYWMRKESNFSQRFGIRFPPLYLLFRTQDPADLGIGGGQFAMMLSSFNLYYDYAGDPAVLANMKFQADWYIKWGFSGPDCAWPNLPYPCNTELLPVYDGDLVLGKGFTQPDKAGDFGFELTVLYRKTGEKRYLQRAMEIADTLAVHTAKGDADHSPLPFKVNTATGEVGYILGKDGVSPIPSGYTTNWTGTLRLFQSLESLGAGDPKRYRAAFAMISDWLKAYPLANNRWGPFFEDITSWSDTEINAGLMAWFILDHPDWVTDGPEKVRHIQDWVVQNLALEGWAQYGLKVIGEQTIYKMQGQSHTARHASIELRYAELTGDRSRVPEAIRQLNWCTYAVDLDGKNRWPNPETYEIWWSDGYGDFMRHFVRAMAADPELCPAKPHLLRTSSVIQMVKYSQQRVAYVTYDQASHEVLRLPRKPSAVTVDRTSLGEKANAAGEYWTWRQLTNGGVLEIAHSSGDRVEVEF